MMEWCRKQVLVRMLGHSIGWCCYSCSRSHNTKFKKRCNAVRWLQSEMNEWMNCALSEWRNLQRDEMTHLHKLWWWCATIIYIFIHIECSHNTKTKHTKHTHYCTNYQTTNYKKSTIDNQGKIKSDGKKAISIKFII